MINKNTEISIIDTNAANVMRSYDYDAVVDNASQNENVNEHYSELTKNISIDNPHSIQNYGQDINKIIASQADEILSKANSANRNTEAINLANKLLYEIKNIDDPTQQSDNSIKSVLKSIPFISKFVKSIEKASIKRNSVAHNVEEISKKFESLKLIAMNDNASLETMGNNVINYITKLREQIVAIMILKKKVEDEIAQMTEDENCDLNLLQQRRNALSAISKRITNMRSTEEILKQNLQMIAGILGNNDSAIDNADMVISQVIPIWKIQLGLSIALDNQKVGVDVKNLMQNAANDMLLKNAQLMHQNSVEIAKSSEESFWKIETLRDSKNVMIDTIKKIQQIHEEGESNRQKIIAELKQISNDYSDALLELK